jgi:hypothetical protein
MVAEVEGAEVKEDVGGEKADRGEEGGRGEGGRVTVVLLACFRDS